MAVSMKRKKSNGGVINESNVADATKIDKCKSVKKRKLVEGNYTTAASEGMMGTAANNNENVSINPIPEKRLRMCTGDEVLLLDRLHSSAALTTLKEIQTKLETGENIIEGFLHEGGTARDLLELLSRADKVKSSEVTCLFTAYEVILLHLGKCILPHDADEIDEEKIANSAKMQKLATEFTQEILANHTRYVMMLLSQSNSVHQVVCSLRLLTAMIVAGGPMAAKEVLMKLDFEHPFFEGLCNRGSSSTANAVPLRRHHWQFLLSFFLAGSSSVIKDFLAKKAARHHLGTLFPGMLGK